MKVFAFIFCLCLSVTVSAQNIDTTRKDTSKHFMIVDARPINKHDKPLIVIDGVIYNGDLKKINPKDILRVDVLKPPGATNIYGSRGEKGVILITTRFQKVDTTKTDTSKFRAFQTDTSKFIKFHERSIPSVYKNFPLYVIDDKQIVETSSNNPLDKINPDDILKVSVFKDAESIALYGKKGKYGVIIITTKAYAKTTYQKKLSAFSKEYRSYLETHQGESTGLFYVINGVPLDGKDEDEITKALYDIPSKKLKSVTFMDKYFKGAFNNSKPLVIIVTKK